MWDFVDRGVLRIYRAQANHFADEAENLTNTIDFRILRKTALAFSPQCSPTLLFQRTNVFLLSLAICLFALEGCGRVQTTGTPTDDLNQVEREEHLPVNYADTARCNGKIIRLQPKLKLITNKFTGIMYNTPYRGDKLDCSGMFHRVLEEFVKTCPNSAYEYPDRRRFRTTRQLARWYHDQGQLVVVRNIKTQSRLIRPGAVMFFGKRGKTYHNPSIEQLEKYGVGIEHMGVVVDVEKDTLGRVANYHLFHGRRTGKPSATTKKHFLDWAAAGYTNSGQYQPLGNWKQQWVAVAPLINPDSSH